VLNADSLASGGGTADYKLLCDSAGAIRVDRLVTPSTSFDRIVAAARAAGFGARNVDYTIFLDDDGGGACGIGSYAEDERLVAGNASNLGGSYAVAYTGCWYDETPMHEVAHNQGAVQYGAPNSTGIGGHCYDEVDVVCYSPDGGNLHQDGTVTRCTDRIHFDCGADDYFDTAPEPGEYLATHWNLGSPLNRFIAFGPQPTPPPTGAATQAEEGSKVMRLRRGKARRGRSAEAGRWRSYWIRVPALKRPLRVVLNGPGCEAGGCETNLDLYVRRGSTPTEASFARRAGRPGSDERARIGARRGKWYVGIRTASGRPGFPFKIKASY
jgi:hypothetical protein